MGFELERKTVTLPTGREVVIKKPGMLTMQRVFGTLPLMGPGESGRPLTEDEERKRETAGRELVCLCSVEPRFVPDIVATQEGTVSLDELTVEEAKVLIRAVLDYAGFDGIEAEVVPLSETGAPS